jgi:hypothetical protein
MTLWRHQRSGSLLVIVQPPTADHDLTLVNARGWQAEMSASALHADYEPVSPSDLADQFPPARLSDTARRVLTNSAIHVVDCCSMGLEPANATKLANVSGVGHRQILRTLNGLVSKGLMMPWTVSGSDMRYVPTVAGRVLIADSLPTREQLAERRAAALAFRWSSPAKAPCSPYAT